MKVVFDAHHHQGARERLNGWVKILLPWHLGDINHIWMENLEASYIFGIKPATLKRWRQKGWLRCYRAHGNRIFFPLCEFVRVLKLEGDSLFAGLKKPEERGFVLIPVPKKESFS